MNKYLRRLVRHPLTYPLAVFLPAVYAWFDKNNQAHPNADTISIEAVSCLGSLAYGELRESQTVSLGDFLAHPAITEFVHSEETERLKTLLNLHGSDKASRHDYHRLYQPIISRLLQTMNQVVIAEIGLGTTDIRQYSNMGVAGNPGASIIAFRNYSKDLIIFGGDVDRNIRIHGERITTRWVDQLQPESLKNFFDLAKPNLAIDDGLHLPHANINFLTEALNTGGGSERWIVIEDISNSLSEFWSTIRHMLKPAYTSWLIQTKAALVLVVYVANHEP